MMGRGKTDYRDLTTGSIWRKLSVFAVPLLLSYLVQQLYNTVDLIFAGNLIDANASAAIGMSGMLITCLVGFFGGLSVGAGAVIARAYGGAQAGVVLACAPPCTAPRRTAPRAAWRCWPSARG